MSEFKQYKLIPDPDGFEPAVEVTFRQEQMDRERLAELLDINLTDPSSTSSLCDNQECAPRFGDKDDCEFYVDGRCTAVDRIKHFVKEKQA